MATGAGPVAPGRYLRRMTVLYWFKRDLRLQDNPALAACRPGPVVPLYIVEPALWAQPDMSARQWMFTSECLETLRTDCAARQAPLLVRVGDAVETLQDICRANRITRIVSTEETGNAWTFARDKAVADWAAQAGIHWQQVPQLGITRGRVRRDGWAARREAAMRAPVSPVPRVAFVTGADDPGHIPSSSDLGLAADPCRNRQRGGRDTAQQLLQTFLETRGRTYRAAMASPVAAEAACSRLSPHLALGTLSVREATQAGLRRQQQVRGRDAQWSGSLASFKSRLAWRDHFMQKLETQPALETHCLHRAFEGMRPRDPDRARLAAWMTGHTGLPFVDACMRYLNATGWLNFRMRSMLMAVASYHLWLDWRVTGQHLARQFTDYEPGIHWAQAQMQSGVTGMNTIRIYNPVKQGHDQDPSGVFTRTWVPELAEVPDRHLQTPWTWHGAGGLLDRTYPAPVVEVTAAAQAAKDKVYAIRRSAGFRVEAAKLVQRHGSRRSPAKARRGAAAKATAAATQLKFDF